MSDSNAAIGVFASGVGGLTVVKQLFKQLPGESVIYLGDTARVPYGTKSGDTVKRYADSCAKLVVDRGIKLLVVACNTASAHALEFLRTQYTLPIIGVIEPGARAAASITQSRRVGVIGTAGTIQSRSYEDAIHMCDDRIKVVAKPCPLFVPLADEGWVSGEVPQAIAQTYLKDMKAANIDTLVLGCTHYPLLKNIIEDVMGSEVTLVDSAESTVQVVLDTLEEMNLLVDENAMPIHQFYVSDAPETFMSVGERFLGQPLSEVEWVDF